MLTVGGLRRSRGALLVCVWGCAECPPPATGSAHGEASAQVPHASVVDSVDCTLVNRREVFALVVAMHMRGCSGAYNSRRVSRETGATRS